MSNTPPLQKHTPASTQPSVSDGATFGGWWISGGSKANKIFAALVILAIVGSLVAVASVASRSRSESPVAAAPSIVGQSWGNVTVDLESGQTASLPSLGPVAIIVSSTCPHCHKVLSDLAKVGVGHGLTIVVIQGLDAGQTLLNETGMHARLAVPTGRATEWLEQVHVNSVPTLLWFDSHGQVRAGGIGELSSDEARTWAERTL